MPILVIARNLTRKFYWVAVLLVCIAGNIRGQSTDVAMPSPVRTNEVTGTIPARDIGDPRLTDYYYAFTGTPGDLLITVDSRNLNGDVDVFTSAGLRPLLKFSVYAGSSSLITKSIYLRTREELLLRVEARTPNDDEGTYRIHFGGAFEPITSGPLLAESNNPPVESVTPRATTGKKGRRVSSVGARIEEPPAPAAPEVAVAPTPEPTPVEPSEKPKSTEEVRKGTARNPRTRSRSPARRRTRPGAEKPEETAAKSEVEGQPPAEEAPATERKTTPERRRAIRRNPTARGVAKAPPEAKPESGPRLIIETSDGTLIDRYMSSVRRVTVENGQVVVVGKDGKIDRILLADVVRMSISP